MLDVQDGPQNPAEERIDLEVLRPLDPTYLYDLLERMYAVEMLCAAVGHLKLFEFLSEHPSTLEELCNDLSLSARPAYVLATMLTSQGLLSRDESGVYSVTRLAEEYLIAGGRWSLTANFEALKDRPPCLAVLDFLKTGRSLGMPDPGPDASSFSAEAGGAEAPDWLEGMQGEAFAESFLEMLDSRNAYLAHVAAKVLDLKGAESVLDIAGGLGIFSCALAAKYPEIQFTVLEKPPVDEIGKRAVERRGLKNRVSVVAFDIFYLPLPSGFDVHLYCNVVHDWDEATVLRLLRSSYDALAAGGRIVIHDSILGAEADARPVAEYSALLAAFTAGRCYSFDELRSLLHQAGFINVTLSPTAIHRSLLSAIKPHERIQE